MGYTGDKVPAARAATTSATAVHASNPVRYDNRRSVGLGPLRSHTKRAVIQSETNGSIKAIEGTPSEMTAARAGTARIEGKEFEGVAPEYADTQGPRRRLGP